MIHNQRRRGTGGETRQELLLIIVVCAIAMIATLSVFVAPLRHLWVALGRLFMR